MKIQILSDLHTESGVYGLTETDADVIVLAGDIAEGTHAIRWAGEATDKPTIMVLGNHELYGGHGPDFVDKMLEQAAAYPHLHLLENDQVVIGGVRFLGSTLWANFELLGDRREATNWAQEIMTDYAAIRTTPGYRKLTPADTIRWHEASVAWLREQLVADHDGPTVVVTHHAPSPRSLRDGHEEDAWSPAYASHLDDLVESSGAVLWIHGHTHHSMDYEIGDTRVVCNARGNPAGRLNPDFLHDLVYDIQLDDSGMVSEVERAVLLGSNQAEGIEPARMEHRHLNTVEYTHTAIDDVIDHGFAEHWAHLRDAALADEAIMAGIKKICDARAGDPWAPRHRLWAEWLEDQGGG